MEDSKKIQIQNIVDREIRAFIDNYEKRITKEVNKPNGVINKKKKNCFLAQMSKEYIFYSAFVRSYESSFGNILEKIGNEIAKLSYDVRDELSSFLLPQQSQQIDYIMSEYENHRIPEVSDYKDFVCMIPRDTRSYEKKHKTDHYFYNAEKDEHYLMELKAGGDLDNKKAKTEKLALLQEYYILKNSLDPNSNAQIKLYFGTAYNKYGEDEEWKQERVKQFFAEEELLIGKEYWNFVCNDPNGFEVVIEQYKESSRYISDAIERITNLYFT